MLQKRILCHCSQAPQLLFFIVGYESSSAPLGDRLLTKNQPGFGSVIAPLICQALLAQGVPWYKFYLGTLVGSALNFAFLAVTFRPTAAEFRREKRQADLEFQPSLSLSPTSTVQAGGAIASKIKAPSSTLPVYLIS